MEIKIDEQKILTEILERDGSVHQKIKDAVEKRLVDDITNQIERKYLKNGWGGIVDEIERRVLDSVGEKQKEMVVKILKEFYDSYRYKKSDLEILKKLKKFIGENE